MVTLYFAMLGMMFFVVLYNLISTLKRFGSMALASNPLVWFSVLFALVHIVTPAVKALRGQYRYQFTYDDTTMILLASSLFLIYMAIAILLKRGVRRANQFMLREVEWGYSKLDRRGWILSVAIVVAIIGVYGAIAGLQNLSEDFLFDRISAGVGRGFARLLPSLLISAMVLFAYLYLTKKEILVSSLRID